MFDVTGEELAGILRDYGAAGEIAGICELLRYNYQRNDPESKEVRLILRIDREGGAPLVIKFKYEKDISPGVIEAQCAFSEHLLSRGIPAARYLQADGRFVSVRQLCGQEIWVTVEEFREGEIKNVDPDIAGKIGRLLARMHRISEEDDCHVDYSVLFDPLDRNDLFSYEGLMRLRDAVPEELKGHFDRIEVAYRKQIAALEPMRAMKRYAVQGDVSDCNLFLTENGDVGVFDFNNCGDNTLFGDAVMQAVFVSRLMDYDRDLTDEYSGEMLTCFLSAYSQERPFTGEEQQMIPHLYAVISALWNDDTLRAMVEKKDWQAAERILEKIEKELNRKL